MAFAPNVGLDPTTLTGGPSPRPQIVDQPRIYGIDPNRGKEISGPLFGSAGSYLYTGNSATVPNLTTGRHDEGPGVVITPSTDMATATTSILRREEGWEPVAKWDVTAYRGGYGTDTITKEDGTIVKVTKGMVISREDAERDLQRQTPLLNAKNARAIGETYAALPGYVQGVLAGITYNYGTLPKSVVAAAKTGDLNKLANAVEARGSDNGGIRMARYKRQANIIRGVGIKNV